MINIHFTLSYIELYLILINVIAFTLYGYDKLQAISSTGAKKLSRVPEIRLLLFALIGGSAGAILSMILFRHKIKKWSFMWKYLVVVGAWYAVTAGVVPLSVLM